jgi:hypothetical protein
MWLGNQLLKLCVELLHRLPLGIDLGDIRDLIKVRRDQIGQIDLALLLVSFVLDTLGRFGAHNR